MSTYVDATAKSAAGQNFSITLNDGSTLNFNLKVTGAPGIVGKAAPSWTGAAVGNTAFLGIPGAPILYTQAGGTNVVTMSGITIIAAPGAPATTAYSVVVADAESTNNGESLSYTTNGSAWTILDQVDPISGSTYPTYTGSGTTTFTENGVAGTVGAYIVGTNKPTTVSATLVGGGLQGIMFAVRFASMRLTKVISGARVDPADQFKFDIAATSSGTVIGTASTTGTGNGPFKVAAASMASGLPITLQESMAAGSVSTLSDYRSTLNCINDAVSSTTPLPNNVVTTSYNFGALQFGDAVQCTFTNQPYPHLKLSKALSGTGRRFASDQFTMNIATGSTVVATTTTTGTGTTVSTGTTTNTKVTAGTNYSFSEAASGSTVLAQYTATIACTNANSGATTTLPTALPAAVTPVMGDVISCTITNTPKAANATLSLAKSSSIVSDGVNATNPKAIPGAIIAYSITVTNSGTLAVDSNTVFLLDPLPANIAYNNGFTPTFANGTPSSGLTYSAAANVKFSNATTAPANFAACTYTPTAGIDPNVTYVCLRPTGSMAAATASGTPNFTFTFQAAIK